jgi:hypothetical protein
LETPAAIAGVTRTLESMQQKVYQAKCSAQAAWRFSERLEKPLVSGVTGSRASFFGRTPQSLFLLAAVFWRYSGPRSVVERPPRRPSRTAAGFFSVVSGLGRVAFRWHGPTLQQVVARSKPFQTIHAGIFGVCEACKRPISKARLEAVPWTRLCTTCKQQRDA